MSGIEQDRAMGEPGRVADVEALIREIQRYLSYLDALRRSQKLPRARRKRRGR